MKQIEFLPEAIPIRHAIAVSFDMSGFSTFCRRHDAHAYLTRYLSSLFKLFDGVFKDGARDFWKETKDLVQVPRPDSIKYTGDGALLLWLKSKGDGFDSAFRTNLVLALRAFQQTLPKQISRWESEWLTSDLPKIARVGVATGPIQPLESNTDRISAGVVDYAGYCINLAVRLQDHCPVIGFIVHAPLQPQIKGLMPLIAVKMKGALDERVFVFEEDWGRAVDGPFRKDVQSRFSPIDEE